jgi:hypothetical protein
MESSFGSAKYGTTLSSFSMLNGKAVVSSVCRSLDGMFVNKLTFK